MDSFQVILAQWTGGVGIAFADGAFLIDLAELSLNSLDSILAPIMKIWGGLPGLIQALVTPKIFDKYSCNGHFIVSLA